MRELREIIIHATATPKDWREGQRTSTKVAEVRRWHVEDNKWSDIGYHFLIDRDGTIAAGRSVSRVGAHVRGRNVGTIGIALFGGHGGAATDSFDDHYTEEQEDALRDLISSLMREHGTMKVSGHNQYANKACPCFNVPEWFTGERSIKTPDRKAVGAIAAGGAGVGAGVVDAVMAGASTGNVALMGLGVLGAVVGLLWWMSR